MRLLLKVAGLMLFGVLAALGALEVTLRLAGIGGPAELDSTYDRPKSTFIPQLERQHPWTPSDGPVLRVAVIGDSFTTAYANQWGDSYGRRLELMLNLNAGAVPAEIRIFARDGSNTWQQLKLLDKALDWGADLVILGVFLNDTEDARDPDVIARKEELLPRVPTGVWRHFLQTSRSLAWIYSHSENIRRNRVAVAYQEYLFEPDYSGWKTFREAIRRFAFKCRKRDVPLLAVIWPSMQHLGAGYTLRTAHERMASALKDAGVRCLDLLPEFEGKSSMRLAAYPDIDLHPNEIGHRIGATAIFYYLLKSGLIDPSYQPATHWVVSEGHYRKKVLRARSPEHFSAGPPP